MTWVVKSTGNCRGERPYLANPETSYWGERTEAFRFASKAEAREALDNAIRRGCHLDRPRVVRLRKSPVVDTLQAHISVQKEHIAAQERENAALRDQIAIIERVMREGSKMMAKISDLMAQLPSKDES